MLILTSVSIFLKHCTQRVSFLHFHLMLLQKSRQKAVLVTPLNLLDSVVTDILLIMLNNENSNKIKVLKITLKKMLLQSDGNIKLS